MIFIDASLNCLGQVNTFRRLSHVSSSITSDFSSRPKLEFKTKVRNNEHERFTFLIQGVYGAHIY